MTADISDKNSKRLQFYILASLFAALTAAGSFIKIPIPYVPITLQTFFVILSGSLLGARFGALSQLIYLSVGLLGAPIFSQGGGPGYVFQPSFGYLLGYPLAAFTVGYLLWGWHLPGTTKSPTFLKVCLVSAIAVLVVFIPGVTVLYLNLKYVVAKPIPFSKAVWVGFAVFIPGDIIKITVSSLLTFRLSKILPL